MNVSRSASAERGAAARLPSAFAFVFAVPPRWAVYAWVVGLNALYLFVRTDTPLSILAYLGLDDALFMKLGRHLANGEWLGPYDQTTLVKGPGYPLFLALNHWLGISISLSTALFHCASITLFVAAVRKLVRSDVLSGLLLLMLLWHPLSLSGDVLRVFRDNIYYAQVLLFLALLYYALFSGVSDRAKSILAGSAGLALGWLWLTREEGIWIVPGVAFVLLAAGYRAHRRGSIRRFGALILTLFAVFASTQIALRVVNQWNYGSLVAVDSKGGNFTAAMKAIASVRSGGIVPYVTITRAARAQVYAASPTFALMQGYFESGDGIGWARISCNSGVTPCGEIDAGHFLYALRDAAKSLGYYATPGTASAFFKRLAREIRRACAQGELQCVSQPIADMPPVTWEIIKNGVNAKLFEETLSALLLIHPRVGIKASAGRTAAIDEFAEFLNDPAQRREGDERTYAIEGWFDSKGADWFAAALTRPDGTAVDVDAERLEGPTTAERSGDTAAARQRFLISATCSDDCMLSLTTDGGEKTDLKLGSLLPPDPDLTTDDGHFHFEPATASEGEPSRRSATARVASDVRLVVLRFYSFLSVPILAIGTAAFAFSTIVFFPRLMESVVYIVAAGSWILVLSRAGLLMLIQVTSTPVGIMTPFYMAPGTFQLICAAVLSIAAWLDLASLRKTRRRTLRPARA